MRILQFGRFWNDQHGGVERHVAELSQGLAARGVDVVNLVAAAGLAGSDAQVGRYRLVQAASFGKLFSTAMSPDLVLRAAALHRKEPFDLFHLHFPDPLTHAASLVLPAGVPRVITWHSGIVRQKRLLALYRPFLQREVLRASALIAATQAHFDTASEIPAALPVAKRHVIPYGLDYSNLALTPHTAALRDVLRAGANGGKLIFALGRHVYYKGFDVLIEAMTRCDATLILGGDGPLRPQLEAQARSLGLENKVVFSGRIPEEELAAYFHACDVFCLPSVTPMEAFGLVQLEAMACGKPVICTLLGNGVNVVNVSGVTGVAVPPGDAAALGQALQDLLADEELRERMGARAHAWAHEHYSLDAMIDRHLALYSGLCSHLGPAEIASS